MRLAILSPRFCWKKLEETRVTVSAFLCVRRLLLASRRRTGLQIAFCPDPTQLRAELLIRWSTWHGQGEDVRGQVTPTLTSYDKLYKL